MASSAFGAPQLLLGPGKSKSFCIRTFEGVAAKVDAALASPAEWTLSDEAKKQIDETWNNSNLIRNEKLRKVSDIILREREQSMNPVSAFFFRGALRSAVKQNSPYNYTLGKLMGMLAGPHYNPIFNRIELGKQRNNDNPSEILIRMHEIEHAHHRNSKPIQWTFGIKAKVWEMVHFGIVRPPLSPFFTTWAEGRAIGSQWELVQRIPKKIRNQYVEEIEENLKDLDDRSSTLDQHEFELLANMVAEGKDHEYFRELSKVDPANAADQINPPTHDQMYFRTSKQHFRRLVEVGLNKKGKVFTESFFREKMHAWLQSRSPYEDQVKIPMTSNHYKRLLSFVPFYFEVNQRVDAFLAEKRMSRIVLASLKNADLPKDEFVRKLQPIHGYNFENLVRKNTLEWDFMKKYLLIISAGSVFGFLVDPSETDKKNPTMMHDVNLLLRFYGWATSGLYRKNQDEEIQEKDSIQVRELTSQLFESEIWKDGYIESLGNKKEMAELEGYIKNKESEYKQGEALVFALRDFIKERPGSAAALVAATKARSVDLKNTFFSTMTLSNHAKDADAGINKDDTGKLFKMLSLSFLHMELEPSPLRTRPFQSRSSSTFD